MSRMTSACSAYSRGEIFSVHMPKGCGNFAHQRVISPYCAPSVERQRRQTGVSIFCHGAHECMRRPWALPLRTLPVIGREQICRWIRNINETPDQGPQRGSRQPRRPQMSGFEAIVMFDITRRNRMKIQKIIVIGAAICLTPLATLADDGSGGSAGDMASPSTFTNLTFPELDKNKDGYIDQTEQRNSKLNADLFKRMDTDSDKRVSQAEFDAYQAKTAGNAVPKKK